MSNILLALLLFALRLTGLDAAAATPVTDLPAPAVPFVQHVQTGAVLTLGMAQEAAEAVTGDSTEPYRFGKNSFVYDGVILGFRDGLLVYILIDYDNPCWLANGILTTGTPTEQALQALDIPFEGTSASYDVFYYPDGTSHAFYVGNVPPDHRRDYLWVLSFFVNRETVGKVQMGDMQYLSKAQ